MGWERGPEPAGRRRPGRAAAVVAVLGALVLVAVAGPPAVRALTGASALPVFAAQAPDARTTGIRAALAELTRGLRTRQEATYLGAVDTRDAALVRRQRSVFRGMQALPLKNPELVWDGRRSRLPDGAARYPAGALTVVADLRYLLEGWDDESVSDGVVLTLAPVSSRWVVVDDTQDAGGTASRRFVEPWTTGSTLDVERRAHVLVVGEAAHRSDVRRLADHLEQVVADVRARWPEPSWNGRVVAYAVTDDRFVQAWFGTQAARGPGHGGAGGAATWEARVGTLARGSAPDDPAAGPPRLVVTPYVLARTDARAVSTLRHEVTHVATVRTGRPVAGWLAEGAAEFTGFRLGGTRVDAARTFAAHGLTATAADQLRHGTWHPQLVVDRDAFYAGTSEAVSALYLDGWIAALYVADRYGDAVLRRLYDDEASRPTSQSWDAVDTGALHAVLGTDHAGFTESVRRYAQALYRQVTGAGPGG